MAYMDFAEIPFDWRVPGAYTEVRPDRSNLGTFAWPARVLLVGQKYSAGLAAANLPQRIFTAAQAAALYGLGSQLHRMVEAFLRANATTELWAAGQADLGGATAATGSFAFTGTPTVAGGMAVYLAGLRVGLLVYATDTASAVATRLAAAINADASLPVSAAASGGTVTVTARHLGDIGNAIDLRLNRAQDEAVPSGLACAVTAMTGGVGAPDLSALLTALAGDWFTDIVVGNTAAANLTALSDELARRYTASGRQDMHGYAGYVGTYSGLISLNAALNSPWLTTIGANASPTPPWIWAATLAGRCAFELTNDPARQLRGLTLPGVLPPDPAKRFVDSERDGLLRKGITTFTVAPDGTVALERVVTTYRTTALGVADTAWLDIMVPKTVSRIRYDWSVFVALTYPRNKLADDGALAAEFDPTIVTPGRMHGAWAARCKLYARAGWIEDETATIAASVFQRDGNDGNRLNGRLKIACIGNLMVLANILEFQS